MDYLSYNIAYMEVSPMERIRLIALLLIIFMCCPGCYLFTPMSHMPTPASFHCLPTESSSGRLSALSLNPDRIYGMGLTYATHLRETGSRFDPSVPPPVFIKSSSALNMASEPVRAPSMQDLISAAEAIEPGLGREVKERFPELSSLLDYEGELAFVVLEEIDWDKIDQEEYAPRLGYLLVNDISARTLAILGEGRANKFDYWGASKSFPGFLPVGSVVWIPDSDEPDSILCVEIITKVNGQVRQKQWTSDMMYTPRQMLYFISQTHPTELPKKGDIVMMGTPGGVAMQMPAWKSWIANLLKLDRLTKLSAVTRVAKRDGKFLKPGDVVSVSGGILGSVETSIVE